MNNIDEILGAIRASLSEVSNATYNPGACDDPSGEIKYFLERAFLQTRLLLEAYNLPRMLDALESLHNSAKTDYLKTAMDVDGDEYSVWGAKLYNFLDALKIVYAGNPSGSVTKDIIEILRGTQYAITDPKCFTCPPKSESDVHVRIEAVLRCLFPDLLTKPSIPKAIKSFEPDTGLPSVRTLIEYKFVESLGDAKRVSDEILADTRGYTSKDWDKTIYVVYETRRVKRESEWEHLLRSSGVGNNVRVVVISGEEPKPKRKNQAYSLRGREKASSFGKLKYYRPKGR
jgi:hypothetical protein